MNRSKCRLGQTDVDTMNLELDGILLRIPSGTVRLKTAGDHRKAKYYAVNLFFTLSCTHYAATYAFLSRQRPAVNA